MRWLAVRLAAIVIIYVACELFLFAVISIKFGRVFSFRQFEARPREVTAGEDPFQLATMPARLRIHKEVVHPYMGYVYDPTVEKSSPYGISDISPVQKRSADKVIVGVFGGSFADDISYMTEPGKLADELGPLFPGREIVVVKATIGGYKQPQQVMALTYFTALGGEFDIVLNIDGFNEVALPSVENLPNTNPFFPRQWHLRTRAVPDNELLVTIGEIKHFDALAKTWSDWFYRAPLRYSVTANTIWRVGDQLLYKAAVAKRAQLPKLAHSRDYAESGPPTTYADDDELYTALGRMWAESSYEMHAVTAAKGARYFHFLQPNQYVEGSKPMGAEERGIAISSEQSYAVGVRKGYPILQQLGQDLTKRGVNFIDLTKVYASKPETIYRDNCCHVNPEGRRVVVAAIAKAVAADLNRSH